MTPHDAVITLRRNPKNPDAWADLGTLLAESGDAERATECFLRALRLDGACHVAKEGLAQLSHTAPVALNVPRKPVTPQTPPPPIDKETRAWSPMTHILLAYEHLTMDEVRATEVAHDLPAPAPHDSLSLGWLLITGFPLLLWGVAVMLYTQSPIADTLTESTATVRWLAIGSVAVAMVMLLGVATYGARQLGKMGWGLAGLAWVLWLVSLGVVIAG